MAEAPAESPSTVLPDELMIEILFRADLSNPLQLRCVCKFWNSLILDPHFMKKYLHRSLTEARNLHNKAKEHYIAFKSQIVANNPIMPQEQDDDDEDEGDELEEEQVDNDDDDDDDDDDDEDEDEAEEEGDELEEEQVDNDDDDDEDDYDEDGDEEAAEEEGDRVEEGDDNEEEEEEEEEEVEEEEEDEEKHLLMNIVSRLDVILVNLVSQLNVLDTIKAQLDDMLVKTSRANLLAQLDRVQCLKSFLQ